MAILTDEFESLEIRVRQISQAYDFEVELVMSASDNLRGSMNLSGYADLPTSASSEEQVAYGLRLFERLLGGNLAEGFFRAWERVKTLQKKLRIRLVFDGVMNRSVHAIPWELMYFDDTGGLNPARPLATDPAIAFSRSLKDPKPAQPIARRPIRMLVMISAPTDLDDWGLISFDKTGEQRGFESRFAHFRESGQLDVTFLPEANANSLWHALNSEPGYDAFLYYGHALHHPRVGSRWLLEEPQTGKGELFDTTNFVQWMRILDKRCPSLVLLIACNSGTFNDGPSLGSLAARMMTQTSVPAVLVMQRLVNVNLARTFTYHLSDQLLSSGIIDLAVSNARRHVFESGDVGWSTPVLYSRSADGRLFTPNLALEYALQILQNHEFTQWRGAQYIEIGVIPLAPGQDWRLLQYRPEDAPPTVNAIEALKRAIGLQAGIGDQIGAEKAYESNLVALIGPPQTGQTTTLRRLTLDLAEQIRQDSTLPLALYISLEGYEQLGSGDRLERMIINQVSNIQAGLADHLSRLFKDYVNPNNHDYGRFVFLLDDLDAIPDSLRITAASEINQLANRLGKQKFVLSCTQDFFPSSAFRKSRVHLIQPLGEREVAAYLRSRNKDEANNLMQRIRFNRLLPLTSDPNMLNLVYEMAISAPTIAFTRNELLQAYLDRRLGQLNARYALGDIARETLCDLAWETMWQANHILPLARTFAVMQKTRKQRDYSLEDLFDRLVSAGLIINIGQIGMRFAHPAIQSYCAAIALQRQEHFTNQLGDIVTICGDPMRMPQWEDTLYALAGLLNNPVPLFDMLSQAIRAKSNIHSLLVARCLEALPPSHEGRIPPLLRQELIDGCVIRLNSAREPSAEHREAIVTALGRLNDDQVINELRNVLLGKVRRDSSGVMRYEYTNVRIAAARSLRSIIAQNARESSLIVTTPAKTTDQIEVLNDYDDEVSNRIRQLQAQHVGTDQDQLMLHIFELWRQSYAGRSELHCRLYESNDAPERALVAFALGDMIYPPLDPQGDIPPPYMLKYQDAEILFNCIVHPPTQADGNLKDEWVDTMWAAADALTLFDPDIVVKLLAAEVRTPNLALHDSSQQQLAYLAGRTRATNEPVVDWLMYILFAHPKISVKTRAMQSLAWMGSSVYQNTYEQSNGYPGPSVRDVICAIAAKRSVPDTIHGQFQLEIPAEEPQEEVYLRRKAIEALAWIGDANTLSTLEREFREWPIELREHWYNTAAAIRRRESFSLSFGERYGSTFSSSE